jgi:membrane protein
MAKKSYWGMVKETFSEYADDKVPRLAAALAYYTIFALAPLLIIAIAIAGIVLRKKDQARTQVLDQVNQLMGKQGADMIGTMVNNAGQHGSGTVATIVSIVILLIAATGVFGELQDSMNTIWEVKPKPQGFGGMLRQRFLSFAMVMGVAFLLLVSLVVSAAVTGLTSYFGISILAQAANIIVSLGVVTLLFAMIFKLLPDVKVQWKDVWIGAISTAILFTIGKYLIGLYLARGSVASVFGAAGSLVAVVVWVFYSAQILFIGAEFTQVYARATGARIVPDSHAEFVTEESRAQAGLSRSPSASKPGQEAGEKWYPAVPVNRSLAVAGNDGNGHGGGSKLVPLLVGAALGKLLLGGGKTGKKAGRGFAPARLLEPGFASRTSHPLGLKDEYTFHVKTPRLVKTAARKLSDLRSHISN